LVGVCRFPHSCLIFSHWHSLVICWSTVQTSFVVGDPGEAKPLFSVLFVQEVLMIKRERNPWLWSWSTCLHVKNFWFDACPCFKLSPSHFLVINWYGLTERKCFFQPNSQNMVSERGTRWMKVLLDRLCSWNGSLLSSLQTQNDWKNLLLV
jgi:hypothetical protein